MQCHGVLMRFCARRSAKLCFGVEGQNAHDTVFFSSDIRINLRAAEYNGGGKGERERKRQAECCDKDNGFFHHRCRIGPNHTPNIDSVGGDRMGA